MCTRTPLRPSPLQGLVKINSPHTRSVKKAETLNHYYTRALRIFKFNLKILSIYKTTDSINVDIMR